MVKKKMKLLGMTLMSAAILSGGAVTVTSALLSSDTIVYAEDTQKVKIHVAYGYDEPNGTWLALHTEDIFLSPGESITITAKEFPGYTFMEFNDTWGYSFPSYTFTYDEVKASGGFVIAPFVYSKDDDNFESTTPVYRLYHSGLKVHLYTTDHNENDVLQSLGWRSEDVAWATETKKGDPVYRMYNAGLKVHLYTKDANEYKVLTTVAGVKKG